MMAAPASSPPPSSSHSSFPPSAVPPSAPSKPPPISGLHLPGTNKGKTKIVGDSQPITRATSIEPSDAPTTTHPSSLTTTKPSNSANDDRSTNVEDLMDAVGASGVDINAEEDSLKRLAATTSSASTLQSLTEADALIHSQSFIETTVLADVVRKIAAEYQLKSLESQTIPFIALAVRTRLSTIVDEAIAAREHRVNSSHFRKPPMAVGRRRRKKNTKRRKIEGDQEGSDHEMDSAEDIGDDDDDDDDEEGGEGEGKEALWDSVIYDEPEKVLGTLEKVDREEERRRRRERVLREQKEQEERELREAVEASERARLEAEGGGGGSTSGGAGGGGGGIGAGPSTPGAGGGFGAGDGMETPKPKMPAKKKKRELGQAAMAKNLTEDVKKRLTDQVAMRSLGGRSFSWLSGAGGAATSTPSRFAPASSLGTPTPGSMLAAGGNSTGIAGSLPSSLNRIASIPALHDANRQQHDALEQWRLGAHVVEMKDVLFAMERERGVGVGKGAGRIAAIKARAGWGKKKK